MKLFTMFCEKDLKDCPWSMTRVVAFLFALTYCFSTVMYALAGKDIGWPFCVLGVVTVLAVPLQSLFRYLQQLFASSPGQKLLRDLLAKVSTTTIGAPATTVKTEVTREG